MGINAAGDWRFLVTAWLALFFFGCAYNALVSYLGELKQGYTAFLVVLGVIVTLAGVALVSLEAAVITFVFFTASGIPMLVGDIVRTVRSREQALRRQREAAELIERRMTDGET